MCSSSLSLFAQLCCVLATLVSICFGLNKYWFSVRLFAEVRRRAR